MLPVLFSIKILRCLGHYTSFDLANSPEHVEISLNKFHNTMEAFGAGVDIYNAIIIGFQSAKQLVKKGYDPLQVTMFEKVEENGAIIHQERSVFEDNDKIIPYISEEDVKERIRCLRNADYHKQYSKRFKEASYYKGMAEMKATTLKANLSRILGVTSYKWRIPEIQKVRRSRAQTNRWRKYRGLNPLHMPLTLACTALPDRLPIRSKQKYNALHKAIKNKDWQKAYNCIGGPGVLTPRANGENL